jgi:phospholipase D1/2
MGGLDACFGRWDTAQHVLIDDGEPHGPPGAEQIWIGERRVQVMLIRKSGS